VAGIGGGGRAQVINPVPIGERSKKGVLESGAPSSSSVSFTWENGGKLRRGLVGLSIVGVKNWTDIQAMQKEKKIKEKKVS